MLYIWIEFATIIWRHLRECKDRQLWVEIVLTFWVRVRVMVFNVTFNNISVISLRPRSTRWKPPTCRKSLTNFILYCSLLYRVHLTWLGFELKTLVQSLPRVVGPYTLSNVVKLWWRIQFIICKNSYLHITIIELYVHYSTSEDDILSVSTTCFVKSWITKYKYGREKCRICFYFIARLWHNGPQSPIQSCRSLQALDLYGRLNGPLTYKSKIKFWKIISIFINLLPSGNPYRYHFVFAF
jgi:hypothetical protein